MSVLSQIILETRQTVEGAKVLDDWLGTGGEPVPLHQAELRSKACTAGRHGQPCNYNRAPKWWERFFKDPIAATIRKHLEVKNNVGLRVPAEPDLHMCQKCGCCLPLKVFVPIQHIANHHKPEYDYPTWCWIRSEMEVL